MRIYRSYLVNAEIVQDDITAFVEERLRQQPAGRRVTLLGESMGGVVALAVTLRCPSLVSRIILVNPGEHISAFPQRLRCILDVRHVCIPQQFSQRSRVVGGL